MTHSRKRPPQGTVGTFQGPRVSSKEHAAALVANRLLYEIGDEMIWEYREALNLGYAVLVARLEAELQIKYGKDFDFIKLLVDRS